MKRTIIHVAQDAIRRNMKHGTNDPAIIIRKGEKSERHNGVQIREAGHGRIIGTFKYQPHKPLRCGARVWLELEPEFEAVPANALANEPFCEIDDDAD